MQYSLTYGQSTYIGFFPNLWNVKAAPTPSAVFEPSVKACKITMSSSTKRKTKVNNESKPANQKGKKKQLNLKNISNCHENKMLLNERTKYEGKDLLSAEFDQDSESKFFNIKSIDSVDSNSPIMDIQTEPPKSIDLKDVVDQILFEKQKNFFKSPEVVEVLQQLKNS